MFDLVRAIRSLAVRRPIFHAEADLQQELAWQIHSVDPAVGVRLEVRVPDPSRAGRRERVDIRLLTAEGPFVIEVKYLTDAITVTRDGELFDLPRQGAQDIAGYDVVKDVFRVEHFVRTGFATSGAVLVVSNDPSCWTDPGHGRITGAAAFRLYEGTTLQGARAWGDGAGPGTRKGREESLVLSGCYELRWSDYSRVPESPRGRFRHLLVEIPGAISTSDVWSSDRTNVAAAAIETSRTRGLDVATPTTSRTSATSQPHRSTSSSNR